jgi:hypothetical protein
MSRRGRDGCLDLSQRLGVAEINVHLARDRAALFFRVDVVPRNRRIFVRVRQIQPRRIAAERERAALPRKPPEVLRFAKADAPFIDTDFPDERLHFGEGARDSRGLRCVLHLPARDRDERDDRRSQQQSEPSHA